MVEIGDFVLMRLSPQIVRPLLVTRAWPDGRVAGELFFYHPEDADCEWVIGGGMFYPASIARRSTFVDQITRGDAVGQWLPRVAEPFSAKLGLERPKRKYTRRKKEATA